MVDKSQERQNHGENCYYSHSFSEGDAIQEGLELKKPAWSWFVVEAVQWDGFSTNTSQNRSCTDLSESHQLVVNTFGRTLLPQPCWNCVPSEPHSPVHLTHLLGIFGSSSRIIQEALDCDLKVFQGLISGQVLWKSFLPVTALQDRGIQLLALIISLHPSSPSLQQSWGWQALAFWKARDVSRGVGLGKTKGILSYSTGDSSRTSVWMLPALLSFCSLPAKWLQLLNPPSICSFFIPTCREDNLESLNVAEWMSGTFIEWVSLLTISDNQLYLEDKPSAPGKLIKR